MIVISGQVRRELIADHTRWRQVGPQEIDIISMARHVTKFAVEVDSANEVPNALEAAWDAATTGRPGPAWISIPLDVQGAEVDTHRTSTPRQHMTPPDCDDRDESMLVHDVITRLRASKRPLILAGNGIHLARAEQEFDAFVRRVRIPVVATDRRCGPPC